MIDSRLLDEPGTDGLERELLSIAAAEAPRPGAKERALAAALAAVSAGAGAGTGAAVSPSAQAGLRLAFLKWTGLAVLLGALGLWALARRAGEPSAAPASSVDRVATSASATPVATPIETTTVPSGSATATVSPPTPSAKATSSSMRSAQPPASASADDQPSLNEEVAALDTARAALQSGSTSGAIAALDSYKKRFPRGALAEEALVLRVEALERRGDHAAAHALADPFLAKNPRGTYANRIRTILGDAGGG